MNVLDHLGCDKVFYYFEAICDIPHGSFHEKELSDYIGCCQSTIYDLKKKGVLDEAIISRVGRKIVFDAEKARVLASNYQSDQREKK